MAHTKLFSTITDSTIWDESPMTCKIWITLLAMSDWHGCVYASVPGLANRARATIEQVEEALRVFRAPDKYSRSQEYEGRRIEDIDGGWLLLNHKKHRDAANREALLEGKRAWAARNAETLRQKRLERSRTVENTARKNDSVSVSASGSGSDLDPEGVQGEDIGERTQSYPPPPPDTLEPVEIDVPVLRRICKSLPKDWQPSEQLIAAAAMQGVPREQLLKRIADLRLGPIGGKRGIFYDEIDAYVLGLVPKWRTWRETEIANAPPAAEPSRRVKGCPKWVYPQHEKLANALGVNLIAAGKAFAKEKELHRFEQKPCDLFLPFKAFLEEFAKRGTGG
jgi:hypothetical protein